MWYIFFIDENYETGRKAQTEPNNGVNAAEKDVRCLKKS